jgi:transglutaminase-like putative cysteine protease
MPKSSPGLGKSRILHTRHKTTYRYDQQVERSVHRLHLRPIQDARQRLLHHELRVSSPAVPIEYEDVFGNPTVRFEINSPYTELVIETDSKVEIMNTDPFGFAKTQIKRTFPLVWLPFEQIMLAPYLTPPELPDTQIEELSAYAMSFVQRNSNDLMETLFAINLSLFRDYAYTPGCTSNKTTPYEVFAHKRGVCQDFTHLFICLARLLGVPARYVCGYIYTGNTGEARAQSDSSHAWVELYIPNVGWKGFDPTNGILPNADHIRLAYGRNYVDATPTSGTLYTPANETMHIDVEVKDIILDAAKQPPCPASDGTLAAAAS